MKVLLCSIFLPSGGDGVSNSTRQLVSALEGRGIDVTVLTTDWGWNAEDIIKQRSDKLHIFKADFNNNFDFSKEMIKYFYRKCVEYDLVHLNSTYAASTVFGAHASKKNNIPYVVSPRGNFVPSFGNKRKGFRSIGKKIVFFNLFSRCALINADKVVCSSEFEMESMRSKIGTDNLTYINNGLDTSIYSEVMDSKIIKEELGIKNETQIFLFLGRLAEEKAIPFLLDVWKRIIQRMSNVVLVIGGASDRGSHTKIKEKIQRLNNPESVLMPGVIKGELKNALLRQSRCVLLPSYFESFGNVVLEALACGTPVIASEGTPWRILEEHYFGKWLPWDIRMWEDAILKIAEDGTYHDENFSKRSKQWVKNNFCWQKISGKYIELYEGIIKRHQKVSCKSILHLES